MVPFALQSGGTAELMTILLFWTALAVPVGIGVAILVKRLRRRDREVEELQERVDELESERD